MNEIDKTPQPTGALILQVLANITDTNPLGDIYAGWLMSQMDLACGVTARKVAQGRVATVAAGNMNFLVPVKVGALVSFYTEVVNIGRSSIEVFVEVWIVSPMLLGEQKKVTEGVFAFVAIDERGRTRKIT